jgi:hypothetical protein
MLVLWMSVVLLCSGGRGARAAAMRVLRVYAQVRMCCVLCCVVLRRRCVPLVAGGSLRLRLEASRFSWSEMKGRI